MNTKLELELAESVASAVDGLDSAHEYMTLTADAIRAGDSERALLLLNTGAEMVRIAARAAEPWNVPLEPYAGDLTR